ncbi:MAG: hypothetical protein MUO72_09595 [Bacteroidales bacterium]|nr:hypothetical protein [Bacteroidales bacterium]
MNGVTREQFELSKVKVLKDGSGVEVIFNVKGVEGGNPSYDMENPAFPHPDLINAVSVLKDTLLNAIGKETIFTAGVVSNFKGRFKKESEFAELEKAIEAHVLDEKTKITVTGVAVSGFDSNRGGIITGTYACKNGSKIALNSPRIRFEGELFGFEQAFQEMVEVIEDEAYLYTFKNKQAQTEIVFEEEK